MSKTETQSVALSLALLLRMQRDSASGVVTHNAASRAAAELEWLDAENKALRKRMEAPAAPPNDIIDAALWREHVQKLDALLAYCPTCTQGFAANGEMTRDQIIFECGKTAGRSAAAKNGGAA